MGSEIQVIDGDVSFWVGKRDEAVLSCLGESRSPDAPFPSGSWQTPPILVPEVSTVPDQLYGCGRSLRRWVDRAASPESRVFQVWSSSWMEAYRGMSVSVVEVRVCCSRVNIPL